MVKWTLKQHVDTLGIGDHFGQVFKTIRNAGVRNLGDGLNEVVERVSQRRTRKGEGLESVTSMGRKRLNLWFGDCGVLYIVWSALDCYMDMDTP